MTIEPHDPKLTPSAAGLRIGRVDPTVDLEVLDVLGDAAAGFALSYLRANPDCVKLLTLDGRLAFMNRNGQCAMRIGNFEAIRDAHWWSLWPPSEEPQLREAVETAALGLVARFEAFCPTAEGEPRWWDVSLLPVCDAAGAARLILAISRDISERRAAKQGAV